jgi:hypothetical protein
MITTMIYYGWLSLFIGGIGLLFGSKYRKTGFTLITLFLTPIALLFLSEPTQSVLLLWGF